jgi:hypothetical protein
VPKNATVGDLRKKVAETQGLLLGRVGLLSGCDTLNDDKLQIPENMITSHLTVVSLSYPDERQDGQMWIILDPKGTDWKKACTTIYGADVYSSSKFSEGATIEEVRELYKSSNPPPADDLRYVLVSSR